MTMKYRPLGDNVLVLPDVAEAKTASGIIIPDSAQEGRKPKRGTVVALGRKCQDEELVIGDVIWYGMYSGSVVQGTPYLVMAENEVLLVEGEEGGE
jgi:chaperonin GroES